MKKKQAPKKQTSKTVVSKASKLKATPKVVSKNTKTASKAVPKEKVVKTKSKCVFFNEKFLTFGIIILVVLIILTLILTMWPKEFDNKDLEASLENTKIEEVNEDTQEILTEEEIQLMMQELQTRMTKDLIATQKKTFESWYDELDLDTEQMNACYLENDLFAEDIDFEKETHILKMMEDTQFFNMLGFNGTPGMYINSYKIEGFSDLDFVTKYIEMALEDEDITIDLEEEEIKRDVPTKPTLTIVYNENHEITSEIINFYLEKLNDESMEGYFENMFLETDVKKIHYEEEEAMNLLKKIKVLNLPLFYLEGDITTSDFYTDERFNNFFYPLDDGYILYLPEMQNLGYTHFLQPTDYIIGDKDAPITLLLFTSYECGYCKMFKEKVVDELMEEYVSLGVLNIVIKDTISSPTAIMPALFSRCAQDQGVYYEAHEKLFENNALYTGNNFLDSIYAKYNSEIEKLNEAYSKLDLNLETQ